MLSYRHAFHAGNDADIFKHVALCGLLAALTRKDKPLLYLETHGGAGAYNLRSRLTVQHQEAAQGIAMLWGRAFRDAPAPFREYFDLVQHFNAGGRLRRYPGSPWIARELLRSTDRAVVAERHPVDGQKLARLLRDDRRFTVQVEDGYALLRTLLPPIERRALIFIDPAYETQDELQHLHRALVEGRKRFAHGVYAIWYPVGTRHHADTIAAQVARAARSGARPSKTLDLRWTRAVAHQRADGTPGMQGCGLLIINPPYGADAALQEALTFTVRQLEPASPPPDLTWPIPERSSGTSTNGA